ncbi:MAG: acid phosphatase [Cellvibrionales bacterium]|nr:MAG: acid phosphatase [Cellvibrionales bacterium]
MDLCYVITPFVAWLIAGGSKFTINSIKARKLAFSQIGYGGLPSNHSAIVGSIAAIISIQDGFGSPAFGVAIALVFIVILDASSLRKQVGMQAEIINRLSGARNIERLRERMGHTPVEIFAGIITGIFSAYVVNALYSYA